MPEAAGWRKVKSHYPRFMLQLINLLRVFFSSRLSSPLAEPTSPLNTPFNQTHRLWFPRSSLSPLERIPPAQAQSEQSTASVPLTYENLHLLQQSLRTDSFIMPSSPSRRSRSPEKSTTADKMDSKDKLQLFSIFYDERAPIPNAIAQHIANLRKSRQASSPNAKRIEEMAPVARSRSEQDGIDVMEEALLLAPASKGGMPCVERAARANLSTHFLPSATSFVAESLRLEMLQPDHCFGYIPSKKARPARLKAPFTIEEENIINRYGNCALYSWLCASLIRNNQPTNIPLIRFTLTTELYFPFFTAQWKSPVKGQTHHQAIPQGARDGSTIVNYLHQFYAIARPTRAPSFVETCYFSAMIDMRSVILWVHWREEDGDVNISYHMEQVESGMLDKERDNQEIRIILRNL